jgi:Uncharacterized low-complexity proteins
MIQADDRAFIQSNRERLKPQCERCFGLCCVALYYSKQDGFPQDKSAGTPCLKLDAGFRCSVHEKLGELGLKGCAAYECFGAGQQVSQVTFAGESWRSQPASAGMMFRVFLILRHLYELCWCISEAISYEPEKPMKEALRKAFGEAEHITEFSPEELLSFDLPRLATQIIALLREVSASVRGRISRVEKISDHGGNKRNSTADFFGKDLRKKDLRCMDLHGACLIAANLRGMDLCGADFIGADLRDADLRGADLSGSLFLSQFQINTARGDSATKLPEALTRPSHWK